MMLNKKFIKGKELKILRVVRWNLMH
ncbi:hypothetical protein Nmel_003296 [Mimus melanotis]